MSVATSKGNLAVYALAIAAFVGGFWLTAFPESPVSPQPSFEFPSRPRAGTEFLVVFIASSDCGASTYPGLQEAMGSIRADLLRTAEASGKLFVSIGVALDRDPWRGLEFLRSFGPFDELLSGGSWLNSGALAFLVRDLPGRRAIPQLVLVERHVEMDDGVIASVSDKLVGRKIGADAILAFAELLATSRSADGGLLQPNSVSH
jgi:hypothetical protein